MKYYKNDERLIQFNPETGIYKVRNTISKNVEDKVLPLEVFNLLDKTQIKKDEFCRLMNIYFKNIKHSWEYDHSFFRKLDNFEESGSNLSSNYNLGKDVPYHEIGRYDKYILVYHWGRVYYHTISYNGYKQGQLIDPKTMQIVRWAQLKNCAPIFNEGTKKIV